MIVDQDGLSTRLSQNSFKFDEMRIISKNVAINLKDTCTLSWSFYAHTFVISLSHLEYHNQATWESGVASMMQNSKLFYIFLFLEFDNTRKYGCMEPGPTEII